MPLVEKVKWRRGQEGAFKRWMAEKLSQTIGDRQALERKWKEAWVQWRGKQPKGEKEFPFPGSSNIEVPLTAMHSDPVYADLMQTFHASEDFWHVRPKRRDRVDHANALREALTRIEQDYLRLREVNSAAFLDNIVLGTGIYKYHWLDHTKRVKDYNSEGEIVDLTKRISQPRIERVPLWYFYIPADSWSIDPDAPVGGAQWVAQKFFLTQSELMIRAKGDPERTPAYDKTAAEFVASFEEDRSKTEEVDEKLRSEDEYQPHRDVKVELFEIWARYDVDGDGIDEDIVVIWHHGTDTILRATHNPFLHGQRPFESIRYLQGPGFYGIGLSEIDEWAQHVVTLLTNAQVDNVLLGNTIMLEAPEGSSVVPGMPIYPGKIMTRPPGDQIRGLQLGQVQANLPGTINQFMQWAEQRTGVSELRQGNITGLPSRTPATSLLSILREGNKKFDEIMGSMRVPMGRMGLRILQMVSQWLREDPVKWQQYFSASLGEDDAALVMEVLQEPVTQLGENFGVEVTAVSALSNKEVEKQNFMMMLQMTSQMGGQLIQLAQLADQMKGTAAGNVAASMYSGGVNLLRRLLERFELQNEEDLLPPEDLESAQQGGIEEPAADPMFAPLGGFFGASPFAQGPRQVGSLIGLDGG